ncbi:hypothetical protein DUNSADRAFT_10095 [Dunaliella salina]|uniref:Uncharacterized protein n=1 Tax=Dunaliella salina TaxID=3046 RepID=A0ABQ7GG35_DUNSA|nr:hypothetical protein DUNSADRAFT_10095 [Dunaliella salina]|eukprot:KAF5833563.1 hypothetical protein DUNSADRAFT_10095 [Dunaliella salina]
MVSIRESSGSRPHSGHSGHLRWEGFPSHYNLHELGSERGGTGSRQRRWQGGEDRDEDRHSQRSGSTHASTAATTASLASRLATLNFEFDKAPYEASILEGSEYDGSEEADVSGGAVGRTGVGLAGLDSPPRLPLFQICSRLFLHRGSQPLQLKRLSLQHCEELRLYGHTIVDNLISKDVAAQIKAAALAHYRRGRMVEGGCAAAAGLPHDTLHPERVLRGDHIMWLAVGRPPADTSPVAQLLVALQEVNEDLAQVVRLKRTSGEYQLCVQPGGNLGMSRHRDAPPDTGRRRHPTQSSHPTTASLSSPAAATPNGAAVGRGPEGAVPAPAGVAGVGLGSGDGAFVAGSSAGYGHVGGEDLFGSGGPVVQGAAAGAVPASSATAFAGGSNGAAPSRASYGSGSIRDVYPSGPPGALQGFGGEGRKVSQGDCSSTLEGEGAGLASGGTLINEQDLPSLQRVSSVEGGVEQASSGPLGLHFVGVNDLAEGERRSSSIPLFPPAAPSSSHHSFLHSQPSSSSIGGDSVQHPIPASPTHSTSTTTHPNEVQPSLPSASTTSHAHESVHPLPRRALTSHSHASQHLHGGPPLPPGSSAACSDSGCDSGHSSDGGADAGGRSADNDADSNASSERGGASRSSSRSRDSRHGAAFVRSHSQGGHSQLLSHSSHHHRQHRGQSARRSHSHSYSQLQQGAAAAPPATVVHAAGGGSTGSAACSDAGLSQQSDERSIEETLSLRSHNMVGQGGGGAGSVTSSTWAELGAQEHETASIDTSSIADPSDQRETARAAFASPLIARC